MTAIIREANEGDAVECGRIAYEAFQWVNGKFGFPPNFPTVETATRRIRSFIQNPSVFAVVAQLPTGQIVGGNFLSERDAIRAVGPIFIDPRLQSKGLGRRLMEVVLERARSCRGVRLLQEAFNMQTLALYAKLGFEVKESVVLLESGCTRPVLDYWEIRALTESDLGQCAQLYCSVNGVGRTNEMREAVARGTAVGAFREGQIRAYLASPLVWQTNHGVAASEEDLAALLRGAAHHHEGPTKFLLPTRYSSLLRTCIGEGFRATRPMNLMSMGYYRQPNGVHIPSVLY